MSKYTAEQVEAMASDLRQAPSTGMIGTHISLPTAKAVAIYEALCNYAALLRERESAKAAVTDEMVRIASDARYVAITGDSPAPPNRCEESDAAMRAALEAVAPMLASIQPPDMVCEQHPWSEWPHDDCAGPGMPGTTQYEALVYLAKLASARVPDEKEDLDPVRLRREGRVVTEWERGFNEGWNDCREAMLAAPNPEKEE